MLERYFFSKTLLFPTWFMRLKYLQTANIILFLAQELFREIS